MKKKQFMLLAIALLLMANAPALADTDPGGYIKPSVYREQSGSEGNASSGDATGNAEGSDSGTAGISESVAMNPLPTPVPSPTPTLVAPIMHEIDVQGDKVEYFRKVESPDGGVYFHRAPSDTAPKIGYDKIPNGTGLLITEECKDDNGRVWGRTKFQNMEGFVPTDGLVETSKEEAIEEEYNKGKGHETAYVATIQTDKDSVWLYQGPGEKFGLTPPGYELFDGDQVFIAAEVDSPDTGLWGKYDNGNLVGWIDLEETDQKGRSSYSRKEIIEYATPESTPAAEAEAADAEGADKSETGEAKAAEAEGSDKSETGEADGADVNQTDAVSKDAGNAEDSTAAEGADKTSGDASEEAKTGDAAATEAKEQSGEASKQEEAGAAGAETEGASGQSETGEKDSKNKDDRMKAVDAGTLIAEGTQEDVLGTQGEDVGTTDDYEDLQEGFIADDGMNSSGSSSFKMPLGIVIVVALIILLVIVVVGFVKSLSQGDREADGDEDENDAEEESDVEDDEDAEAEEEDDLDLDKLFGEDEIPAGGTDSVELEDVFAEGAGTAAAAASVADEMDSNDEASDDFDINFDDDFDSTDDDSSFAADGGDGVDDFFKDDPDDDFSYLFEEEEAKDEGEAAIDRIFAGLDDF
ncbi:MAG: hypothetical protein HUJ72_11460 [Blautia sp.]|nr:hypothetical protein [Blautia sp.]